MYSVLDCGINDYKFEYETGFPSTFFKVENFKKHVPFWKSVLKANDFVLNSGY